MISIHSSVILSEAAHHGFDRDTPGISSMNLADYAAHFSKLNGVNRVFGLPGGENLLFLESLRRSGQDRLEKSLRKHWL
jgi:hypothetical protein